MIQNRKLEHLNICNEKDVAYKKSTGFENIEFVHRALCEVNKSDINISTDVFSKKLDSPLFISAITGGHPFAEKINKELAIVAEEFNIGFGLGSQRAGIEHSELASTYTVARQYAPNMLQMLYLLVILVLLKWNLQIVQLI